MEQKEVTEAYNSAVSQYVEKCYTELEHKPMDRQLLDRFANLTNKKGKVLDIGCGPGQTTKYLHSRGSDVLGVDISDGMISAAKTLNNQISFEVGDMFCLRHEDGTFVGICSFYAFVNFKYDKIEVAFREYARVLKPKGLLLMAFHTEEKRIDVPDFFRSGKPLEFYYFDE